MPPRILPFACGFALLKNVARDRPAVAAPAAFPYIFVKHVYACASIAGAICCVLAYRSWGQIPALVIGTVVVLVIRIGAAHYRWNLPCVKLVDEE